MKVLHIFSNWKWTGPAEHALNLAATQQKGGHQITFACGSPPKGVTESIVESTKKAGITPETLLMLNNHFNIFDNIADVVRLRRFIQGEKFDLIHAHLKNDHFLSGTASRLSFPKIPVLRTCYDGDGIKQDLKNRVLLSTMTDGLITISDRTRNQIIQEYNLSPEKIWKVHIPVNQKRFDIQNTKSNRSVFGLSAGDIVGGIVARVQKHRRFEILLEALRIVLQEFPRLKFMIIGRGTHIEEIAIRPAQAMGIRPNVIFTGYRGKDFPETLACLNFKIFLVPGTDGSCRAVREAMAIGIPIIAANRGMLPEIIEHETEGLIIEDTPGNLAKAMMTLIENPSLRHRLRQNALKKALEEFDLEKQTKKIEAIYTELISSKAR
jgi:glycosyltransferase involved in cell wall biosynthesis